MLTISFLQPRAWVCLGVWVPLALAASACTSKPLELTVTKRLSATGIDVEITTSEPTEQLSVASFPSGFFFHAPDVPGSEPNPAHLVVHVKWAELPRAADGGSRLDVTARASSGSTKGADIPITAAELKGMPAPQKGTPHDAPGGDAATTGPTPTPDHPVVLIAASGEGDSAGVGYALSGALGERRRVTIEPLALTLVALPDASVAFAGTPLTFDHGKATLTVSHRDLLLATSPVAAVGSTSTPPVLRAALAVTVAGKTQALTFTLTPTGDAPSEVPALLAEIGKGTPIAFDGARSGAAYAMHPDFEASGAKVVLVDAPTELRALAFAGLLEYAPRPATPARTCPYEGGYSERHFRQALTLRVFDAATGKLVGQRELAGVMPERCAGIGHQFNDQKSHDVVYAPTEEELTAALRALIAR